jgi:5-formyltetrahydrofolate cyclo-ligase
MSWVLLSRYEEKQQLRRRMLALRNSKSATELDQLSSEITKRLIELPEVKNAQVLSTYLNIGSEVRTMGIVDWALSQGKSVIVPVTDRFDKRMIFSELKDPSRELVRGNFGIAEPKEEFRRPVHLDRADAVLVPGVAWDAHGLRIGYGAGYYDRSINSLHTRICTIGLSYEFQFVDNVPKMRYDRRVDKIVTDRRVIVPAESE